MQALLSRWKWQWEKARDELPGLVAGCLPGDPHDLIGPGLAIETKPLTCGK
jgi:hypothetical protein